WKRTDFPEHRRRDKVGRDRLDLHSNLIIADGNAIAIMEQTRTAMAKRLLCPVDKDPVGAEIGYRILAVTLFNDTMTIGNVLLCTGRHPIVPDAAANRQSPGTEALRQPCLRFCSIAYGRQP